MDKKTNYLVFYINFIMMLLVMVLIFCFSAQDGNESGEVSNAVLLWLLSWTDRIFPVFMIAFIKKWIRKIAHFTIYFVLGIFADATVLSFASIDHKFHPRWYLGWLIAVLYACTDEFHQYFVPGRACQLRDVMIDAIGALLGVILIEYWNYCFRLCKIKNRNDVKK